MDWAAISARLLLTLAFLDVGTSCLEVTISPGHVHTTGGDISVLCQTLNSTPIVDCQFRVWFVESKTQGELLNASTVAHVAVNNTSPPGAYSAHFEKNFGIGECGVRLEGVPGNQLLVGCKLTTPSNMAAIKTASVLKTNHGKTLLTENNEQVVVAGGGQAKVLVKAITKEWLHNCTSILPNKTSVNIAQDKSNDRPSELSRYEPFHWRQKEGECGFTISNVQEQDSGVFFVLANKWSSVGAKAVTLIVKNPHIVIELSLSEESNEFVAGETVTVTCSVHGVRQPDVLAWTWILGDRRLVNASKGYSNPDWSWPWQKANVSRSLTLTLEAGYDGQVIGCHVEDIGCHVEDVGWANVTLYVTPVPAGLKSGLVAPISGVTTAMLFVILVVAVVALAAVRRRACFRERQHPTVKSQTAQSDGWFRPASQRRPAPPASVHAEDGRRQNNRHPHETQGRRPTPQRGPATAGNASPRVAPPTASPPPKVQVVQPNRVGPGRANPKRAAKEVVDNKATSSSGQIAVVSTQINEPPDVQYANAAAWSLAHGHGKQSEGEEAEYLNVVQPRAPFEKNLPQREASPKERGNAKKPEVPAQWAQGQSQAQGQRALQEGPHADLRRLPRSTAAIRPMPRPADASLGLATVRRKEDEEKVVYAQLRMSSPAAPRKVPTAQKEEVVYATLDFH